MAINKKLIHFNKKTTFNSQKLSANASNTQYQVGGTGTVQTGAPDINYQSIVYIKDSKEIWTHGQFYATAVTWSAITGKPSFATVATSGNYNDLNNKPSFATVATSGSYNDLSNKPTIPTKLPTPNALTFTGAVTGTWDGSSAKTVNIPSGSSYTLPLASNSTRGGIKLSSSTQGGTPNGITTTSGRTYAVQVNSSEQAVVNVPWTDTTYTLPNATSSVLGGIKVGNGLVASSGVLSVTAPQVNNNEFYNLVGYKSGITPLKNTPQITFRTSEIAGNKYANLLLGDNDSDGPGATSALWFTAGETAASINGEHSRISLEAPLGDVAIVAGEGGGSQDVILQCSNLIKLINTGEGDASASIKPAIDADSYSRLQLGTSSDTGVNVVQMTLGGLDKEAHFFGAVSSPGGFFDTSDARVKINVKELDASKADKVRLVEFDRTDREHHGYGVIAQELEEVYPEMIHIDEDGFKSVNYDELAMVKIKYLEDKVARLEALVGRLLAE